MKNKKVVAAGGYDTFNKTLLFTRTFEECEAADFHHSGIIPPQYMEKMESNEYKYFICRDGEVIMWTFSWEEKLYINREYRGTELCREIKEAIEQSGMKLRIR